MEAAGARNKVHEMLAQLDDNNREIQMQRLEIRRLREQVHMLVSQIGLGGQGMGDERGSAGLAGALGSVQSVSSDFVEEEESPPVIIVSQTVGSA